MTIKNGSMPTNTMFDKYGNPNKVRLYNETERSSVYGLTKREQFAAMAMQGLLSNSVMGDGDLHNNASDWKKDIVESATEFADALLAQLEEK